MLTARLGPAANGTPPIEPDGDAATPSATPPSDEVAEPEPQAEQEQAPVAAEQQSDAEEQPDAETVEVSEPSAPPVEDDLDEVYDEPQPRNVRRRPFTSRLLRS